MHNKIIYVILFVQLNIVVITLNISLGIYINNRIYEIYVIILINTP